MENYFFCNRIIKSNIQLTELINGRASSAGKPILFFLENPIDQLNELIWKHDWKTNGAITLNYGIQATYHILHFPGLADFKISADTYEIHCHPLAGIPEFTVRHLLLDQVIPRCIAHQGNLMLHASAVNTPKGVILFTGGSGAGKSTLAGYFHQSGDIAISDDCMLIKETQGRVTAIASYSGVRLWHDSQAFLFSPDQETHEMAHYSSKQRVALSKRDSNIVGGEIPVVAVIFLSSPVISHDKIKLHLAPVNKREGYIELLKQIYQLDVTDVQKLSYAAKSLGKVVQETSLYRITMPRDYASLPAARQLILDTVLK